ncbi:CRISPR-associated protein Cas4 [Gloeomargarita lithophora Alchichica-D10]|uniref:CRISPR-associated exonuclease Cas4 n=1 Tax=Gloeomargarita lithophora Alchichica-D10 TaxID=1188229 RepID=A0A1J0ACL8_9CYAN|nr:CRISPR-associated protein Cas4 [Gloeomargarita lithophora]APB33678.1 CRISPR-associated protein Cas4 [Gloeomargarita lithophora Alchichica-D10]
MEVDDYIMLSELQHFVFCSRQWALIHLEQVWEENLFTLRGQRVHEIVNTPDDDLIEGVRVERSLPVWHHGIGLTGIADLVEFHDDGLIYPVEYKSGSKKPRLADEVQLCAQAMCLEEMLKTTIPKGAIFHHASRRRREVIFCNTIRNEVIATANKIRDLRQREITPNPVADKRCPDCSLIDACMPYVVQDSANPSFNLFSVEDE